MDLFDKLSEKSLVEGDSDQRRCRNSSIRVTTVYDPDKVPAFILTQSKLLTWKPPNLIRQSSNIKRVSSQDAVLDENDKEFRVPKLKKNVSMNNLGCSVGGPISPLGPLPDKFRKFSSFGDLDSIPLNEEIDLVKPVVCNVVNELISTNDSKQDANVVKIDAGVEIGKISSDGAEDTVKSADVDTRIALNSTISTGIEVNELHKCSNFDSTASNEHIGLVDNLNNSQDSEDSEGIFPRISVVPPLDISHARADVTQCQNHQLSLSDEVPVLLALPKKKKTSASKAFQCRRVGCNKSFSMAFDLYRHENQAHAEAAQDHIEEKPLKVPDQLCIGGMSTSAAPRKYSERMTMIRSPQLSPAASAGTSRANSARNSPCCTSRNPSSNARIKNNAGLFPSPKAVHDLNTTSMFGGRTPVGVNTQNGCDGVKTLLGTPKNNSISLQNPNISLPVLTKNYSEN